MLILLDTNNLDNVKQWFIFDISMVNLYLSVYSKLRQETTVARQREQISWMWKQTFIAIGSDQIFMSMSSDQLEYLTRIKTRLESCKSELNLQYPRRMKFKSDCFTELLEKGSMITKDEEISVLIWLLNNFKIILDVWYKIDKGVIIQFPKPKEDDTYLTYIERVKPDCRNLYKQLIKDTQVIIGCIMVIFLYGQRTQISNSLTINTLYKIPEVGLILKPIYEKVTRRATGLSLNNQLESILNWQINYMRKKCTQLNGVKAVFIKKNGKPYSAQYWSELTKNFICWYNPDIKITGSSTFRRALFSFNDFNSEAIRDVVVKLYNVKSSTGIMYYKTTDVWDDMRKLHENQVHAYIESNPNISSEISGINQVINTSFPSVPKQLNTNVTGGVEADIAKRLFITFSFADAKFKATYNDETIDVDPDELVLYDVCPANFLKRYKPPLLKDQSTFQRQDVINYVDSSDEEEEEEEEEKVDEEHEEDDEEQLDEDAYSAKSDEEQQVPSNSTITIKSKSPFQPDTAQPPMKLRKLSELLSQSRTPVLTTETRSSSVFSVSVTPSASPQPSISRPSITSVTTRTPSTINKPVGSVIRFPHSRSRLLPAVPQPHQQASGSIDLTGNDHSDDE